MKRKESVFLKEKKLIELLHYDVLGYELMFDYFLPSGGAKQITALFHPWYTLEQEKDLIEDIDFKKVDFDIDNHQKKQINDEIETYGKKVKQALIQQETHAQKPMVTSYVILDDVRFNRYMNVEFRLKNDDHLYKMDIRCSKNGEWEYMQFTKDAPWSKFNNIRINAQTSSYFSFGDEVFSQLVEKIRVHPSLRTRLVFIKNQPLFYKFSLYQSLKDIS